MNPIIYYRSGGLENESEFKIVSKYFRTAQTRMTVQENDLVICRYSAWPYHKELEEDVEFKKAKLINSTYQHRYAADLQNYVVDLGDLTPRTWDRLEDLPDDCSFILKGETNSKKFEFKTHFFAENKAAAGEVYSRLCVDGLIGTQKIYIREFVPLDTYFESIGGLPVTQEYRIFVAYEQILSGGFYWSNHMDQVIEITDSSPNWKSIPIEFLNKVIQKIGRKINFYAVDIAKTTSGDWIVIEINDGTHSGLSLNDPDELYKNLAMAIKTKN